MQTSLIIVHAPPHVRSRLMGLLTVCIGMGPLGILLIGALADWLGPLHAVDVMALSGLVVVLGVGRCGGARNMTSRWRWRARHGERNDEPDRRDIQRQAARSSD